MHHRDYTVGWVCALPTERAAAVGMLDNHHDQLLQPPHDQNVYTLGRIGAHNVVIACLPAGVTGTTSAAIVATQMLSTFTSIRFGLLVGIGGGVPSQESNIRLGDVVVGKPSGTSGGVIQYDFGKTVQEGRFVRTGSLNRPPDVVLNAVAGLQAKHILEDPELSKHLSEIVSKYPKLRTSATYQGIEHDVLFEAEYDHQEGDVACTRCNVDRSVSRPARNGTDPAIHYGLIASGNQVMRNGSCRERLRRELNVLCFEMEAAGLMDNFPCLVVRGICDYADSHKNKRWQAYAAATAAAYAKELLYVIPQNHVMETRLVAEEVKGTSTPREYTGPPSEQHHLHHTQSSKNSTVLKTTPQMSALTSSTEPQFGHQSLAHSKTIRHPRTKIWTYRLEKLPTTVTMDTVQSLFGVDGRTHLRIRSLVPVVDSVNGTRTQTATMEYQSPSGDAPECLDRKIVITRDFHGFTPLNNALEPISADIIAVTGLAGHAFGSWAVSSYAMWLRDILPVDFPNARVLTYGYGSELQGGLSGSIIADHGAVFWQKLKLWRADAPDRPIIFIGHSLGCLIIKQVLSQMNSWGSPSLPVTMIIFMGAPHQGLETDALERLVKSQPTQKLITELKPESPTMRELNENFKRVVKGIRIVSCYETHYSRTVAKSSDGTRDGPPILIVPVKSALLHLDLEQEHVIASATNHSDLAKLQDDSGGIYPEIRAEIASAIKKPVPSVPQDRHPRPDTREIDTSLPKSDPNPSTKAPLGQEVRLRKTLETTKKMKGPNHLDTLTRMHKLADWLAKEGDEDQLLEAEKLCRQVQQARQRKLGLGDTDTLASLDLLGSILEAQEKIPDAENFYRVIMQEREEVQGPDAEDTLLSIYRVADILYQQNKSEEAEHMLRSLLERRLKVSSPNNVKTLETQSLLAKSLIDQERYTEARDLLKDVLQKTEDHYGRDSEETLVAVQDLGKLCGNLEDFSEAEELLIRAWKGRQNLYDKEDDYWTLESANSLADVYNQQSKYAEAADVYRAILEATEDNEEDEDRVRTLCDLGVALYWGDDVNYLEAERVLREALGKTEVEGLVDEESDLRVDIPQYLGRVLLGEKKYDEAETFTKRALDAAEKSEDQATVGDILHELGSMLSQAGRLRESVDVLLTAIQTLKEDKGSEIETFRAMRSLANVYQKQHIWSQADKTLTDLLSQQEAELGPTDEMTLETIDLLIEVLGEAGQGQSRRARSLQQTKASRTGGQSLPAGWEARVAESGHVYYIDHNTKTTSWVPPSKTGGQSLLSGRQAPGAEASESFEQSQNNIPAVTRSSATQSSHLPDKSLASESAVAPASRKREEEGNAKKAKGKKTNAKEAKGKSQSYAKSTTAKLLAMTFEDSGNDDLIEEDFAEDMGPTMARLETANLPFTDGYGSDPITAMAGSLARPFSAPETFEFPEECFSPYPPHPTSMPPTKNQYESPAPAAFPEEYFPPYRPHSTSMPPTKSRYESPAPAAFPEEYLPPHRPYPTSMPPTKNRYESPAPAAPSPKGLKRTREVTLDSVRTTPVVFQDVVFTLEALNITQTTNKLGKTHTKYLCEARLQHFLIDVDVTRKAQVDVKFSHTSGSDGDAFIEVCTDFEMRLTARLTRKQIAVKFDRGTLKPSHIISTTADLLHGQEMENIVIGEREGPWTRSSQICELYSGRGKRRSIFLKFDVRHNILEDEAFMEVTFEWVEGNRVTFERIADGVLPRVESESFKRR